MKNDFRFSKTEEKNIIIHKLNLFNLEIKLMFYCYLYGNFVHNNTYSFYLICDYIINNNEINQKQNIHIFIFNKNEIFV